MREENNGTCQEVEKLTEVGNKEVTKLTSADDSCMIAAKPWPFLGNLCQARNFLAPFLRNLE